jgi:hypothetical protein
MTVYTAMLGLWVFTTVSSLTRDVSESVERYNVSVEYLRAIQVVLALPLLFIYAAVAFAAVTFVVYSYRISSSKEGSGYSDLSTGLMLTVGSFVLSGLFGVVAYNYIDTPSETTFTIVRNYANLLIGLGIYFYFYIGSAKLISTLKNVSSKLVRNQQIAQFAVLVFGSIYTYFVFQNPYRTVSSNPDITPVYGLPDALILVTIIIPYLFSWLLGATATVNLFYYSKNVVGIIYKKIFEKLAKGFVLIITLTISLQIVSQFSDYWAQIGLNSILGVIGIIFAVLIVAYLQFGSAAKKLDKIETV